MELCPLDEFYRLSHRPLPAVVPCDAPAVPEPAHSLLVHTRDMTPTLAAFHGAPISLRVLRHQRTNGIYSREIVLEAAGRPVLFGAIRIYVDRFPPAARELILADSLPLGAILQSQQIAHTSRPEGFFAVEPDELIRAALGLPADAAPLYGRRNVHWSPREEPLAEVVEILAP